MRARWAASSSTAQRCRPQGSRTGGWCTWGCSGRAPCLPPASRCRGASRGCASAPASPHWWLVWGSAYWWCLPIFGHGVPLDPFCGECSVIGGNPRVRAVRFMPSDELQGPFARLRYTAYSKRADSMPFFEDLACHSSVSQDDSVEFCRTEISCSDSSIHFRRYGWVLFTEWVLFTFTALYGAFLWQAYHAGRISEGSPAGARGTPTKIAAGHRYAQPWPPTLMCALLCTTGRNPHIPPHLLARLNLLVVSKVSRMGGRLVNPLRLHSAVNGCGIC